jgi:hypothetical protein
MGEAKKIDLCIKPSAFFQERLSEVMHRRHLATLEVAEFYIVDLLTRFTTVSNLFDERSRGHDQDPLAIMFLKAQSKDIQDSEKINILKKLGDTSLYISGFFGESLSRKIIDLEYYREMGSIAYRSLSRAIRDDQFQELYNELHGKFSQFVAVLSEISQEMQIQSNQDLMRVYELYLQTGSAFAKNQLSEKGLPTPPVLQQNPKIKN